MYGDYATRQYNDMQRRLNSMERAYPQYANGGQYDRYPYAPMPEQRYMQPQPQQQFIKCIPVSGFDEVKACMIDFDGSLHVFTDIGNGKIYTKQITLDGTPSYGIYALETGVQNNQHNSSAESNAKEKEYVTSDMIDDIIQQKVEERVKIEIKKVMGGKNNARNAVRSDESKTDAESNSK